MNNTEELIMDNNQNNPFGQQVQPEVTAQNQQTQYDPKAQYNPNQQYQQAQYNQNQQYAQGNAFQQQYMAPQPPKYNLFELISIICSGLGMIMVILGTVLTCSLSASRISDRIDDIKSWKDALSLSPVFIVAVIGIMVAIAGMVLAIVALKQKNAVIQAGKIAKLAVVLGGVAVVFGVLPLITMCGYNGALSNEFEDMMSIN